MSNPPSINALLAEWWNSGGVLDDAPVDPWFSWNPALATNLIFGGNPVYQVSDFLAFYPKFGSFAQAIASISIGAGGTGYMVGDTLVPQQADASGAVLTVATIGGGGAVTGVAVTQPGTGYSVANALPTTTSGAGTGCTINITGISPGNLQVPPMVIQAYVGLASACLQKARWCELWTVAMGWFVAHYCTLYLDSDGSTANTAGQIAQQGLAKGIAVSKGAGDVSVGYETLKAIEDWGAWTLTKYGQQLATHARIIGLGPMYIL